MALLDQTLSLNSSFVELSTKISENCSNKKKVGTLKVFACRGLAEASYPVYDGENVIGRCSDQCQINIPLKVVSKRHAVIEVEGDTHMIYDSGSHNKSYRGNLQLKSLVRYEIQEGDTLKFGDIVCKYSKIVVDKDVAIDSGSETESDCILNDDMSKNDTKVMDVEKENASKEKNSCENEPKNVKTVEEFELKSDSEVESDNEDIIPSSQPTAGCYNNIIVPETPAKLNVSHKGQPSMPLSANKSKVSESGSDTDVDDDAAIIVCDSYDSDKGSESAADTLPFSFLDAETQAYPACINSCQNKIEKSSGSGKNVKLRKDDDVDWSIACTQKFCPKQHDSTHVDDLCDATTQAYALQDSRKRNHSLNREDLKGEATIPIDKKCKKNKAFDKSIGAAQDFISQSSDESMTRAQHQVNQVICSPALTDISKATTVAAELVVVTIESDQSSVCTETLEKREADLKRKQNVDKKATKVIQLDDSETDVPISKQYLSSECSLSAITKHRITKRLKYSEESSSSSETVCKDLKKSKKCGDFNKSAECKKSEMKPTTADTSLSATMKNKNKSELQTKNLSIFPDSFELNPNLSSSSKTYSKRKRILQHIREDGGKKRILDSESNSLVTSSSSETINGTSCATEKCDSGRKLRKRNDTHSNVLGANTPARPPRSRRKNVVAAKDTSDDTDDDVPPLKRQKKERINKKTDVFDFTSNSNESVVTDEIYAYALRKKKNENETKPMNAPKVNTKSTLNTSSSSSSGNISLRTAKTESESNGIEVVKNTTRKRKGRNETLNSSIEKVTVSSTTPNTKTGKQKMRSRSRSLSVDCNPENDEVISPRWANLKPKVMFTGLTDTKAEKVIKSLGGKIVDSVFDCTHIVTDKIRRTCKLLCIVARGQPVVSVDWLLKSSEAKRFLDAAQFLIDDKEAETRFGFSLAESLKRASQKRCLEGYSIHVTSSVKPDPEQMQPIIECAGGQFLQRMPRKSDSSGITVVISCSDDLKLCVPALRAGIPIVSAEFILTGILRQTLEVDENMLSVEDVEKRSGKGKQESSKCLKKEEKQEVIELNPSPRQSSRKRKNYTPVE